jgi:hypothetical protein
MAGLAPGRPTLGLRPDAAPFDATAHPPHVKSNRNRNRVRCARANRRARPLHPTSSRACAHAPNCEMQQKMRGGEMQYNT